MINHLFVKDYSYKSARFAKSVFDRFAALAILIVLSPLFVLIALKVRQDGGPVFYAHHRLGQNGKPFKCYKFRSMVTNSQDVLANLLADNDALRAEWERDFKLKDDPRVTKVGHFLRESSLDELPQLWNVLKGEMSLVGPRPIIEDERKYYGEHMDEVFSSKPGLTGLWQVSGRNDVSYDERVDLDTRYVKQWTFWKDIEILFKTVAVVLNRRGAY